MTLQELVDELGKKLAEGVSPDTPVYTQGCDCNAEVAVVAMKALPNGEKPYVYLERDAEFRY